MLEFHLGNLYTKVNRKVATKEELKKLHNILSVKIPGHYFSPKFRRGLWDGYKRFFNLLTCTFYTGLLSYATSRLDGIEYKIIDDRMPIPHQNNPLILNGIELRDYQIKMIEESIKLGRGIISAPPNAGKTEVAAGIIKILGLPAIFLTHRLTLLRQTRKRFEDRLGIKVGLVGGGVEEWESVTVASVQTIHRKLDEFKDYLKSMPVVIVDECHHTSSKTFEKCLKSCGNAKYRFGLSATPLLRDDISNMLVRGLTGDEIVSVTNQELISSGISAFPTVYLLNVREPKIPAHYTFDLAYDFGILNNKYRNGLIVSSAERFLDMGKSVFILVWRIEHGNILLDVLTEKNIQAEFISGGNKPEYIQEVLTRFSGKQLKCVVSSTISDEGLDIPSMDTLIIAVGFKSALKTIQRVGRGLRKKKDAENVVTIVDFVDHQSKKYLYRHSVDRCREYVKMGMPIFEVLDDKWERVEER